MTLGPRACIWGKGSRLIKAKGRSLSHVCTAWRRVAPGEGLLDCVSQEESWHLLGRLQSPDRVAVGWGSLRDSAVWRVAVQPAGQGWFLLCRMLPEPLTDPHCRHWLLLSGETPLAPQLRTREVDLFTYRRQVLCPCSPAGTLEPQPVRRCVPCDPTGCTTSFLLSLCPWLCECGHA